MNPPARARFTPAFALLGLALWADVARADTVIYDDELAPGWTSWSWDGEYAFDHEEDALDGEHSITATVESFGGLSLHSDQPFPEATGVSFWLRGDSEPLIVFLHADDQAFESDWVALADVTHATPERWVLVGVLFEELGDHDWTRISIMNTGQESAAFLIDDVVLLGVDLTGGDEEPDAGADAGLDLEGDGAAGDDLAPSNDGGGCRIASRPPVRPDPRLFALAVAAWLARRNRSTHVQT